MQSGKASHQVGYTLGSLEVATYLLFREDGEIVSDSMDFEVDGVLSNVLDISMDKKQAFPGKNNEPAFVHFISTSYLSERDIIQICSGRQHC